VISFFLPDILLRPSLLSHFASDHFAIQYSVKFLQIYADIEGTNSVVTRHFPSAQIPIEVQLFPFRRSEAAEVGRNR
jgi:hypothetical protein